MAAAKSVQQHDCLLTLAALQGMQGLIQETSRAKDSNLLDRLS
jgi:hypothetical protein